MDVTWVVVADSSRARLFALGQQNQLGELQDFINPAGRETENALNSDASGRFGSGLHDTRPEPTDRAPDLLPCKGVPVGRTTGSRTSEHCCRRHICLSP